MNFDRLAPVYRGLEWVLAGSILQNARTCHFDRLGEARQILVVGEGVGRSLEQLVRRAPAAKITVVEASAGMIEVARRRLAGKHVSVDRVTWHHGDIRSWDIETRSFDTVITPFVMDCFLPADVEAIVARIRRAVSPGGQWLHADFQIPPRGWRRARARLIHALMYRTFRTLVNLEAGKVAPAGPSLERAGFRLESKVERCGALICSELWRLPR
ncbi:MAG: class I SAM-dependent methyltransferase [Opitutaceae bacterium]|nr:class I SAM-dependent methyltransferase [Opitutaceae bacterium]